MSNANITRNLIITNVKAAMEKKPLDKIQVREITQSCGINRNTFYYHFKDKYEILETIYEVELLPKIAPLLTRKRWVESLAVLTDEMKQAQAFYTHAMFTKDGLSLADMLTRTYRRFLLEEATAYAGALEYHKREIIVRFYSHAIIGMLCDWVRFGMKQDVREAMDLIAFAVNKNIFSTDS